MDFNAKDTNDDSFDSYFKNKRDLGKIIRELGKLVGVNEITGILMQKLENSVQIA